MADSRSAAIAIGGRQGAAPADMCISQSLPCKPRSLAVASPAMEPPPFELPKSSPAETLLDIDEERSLIRLKTAEDISAEEFSSTPAQREMYLSASCPSWSTFQLPKVAQAAPKFEVPEEPAEGAVAVPGHAAVENLIEAEVGIIGKSPTILESFKIYNREQGIGLDDDMAKNSLDDIIEDEPPQENDDDDEAQFALD